MHSMQSFIQHNIKQAQINSIYDYTTKKRTYEPHYGYFFVSTFWNLRFREGNHNFYLTVFSKDHAIYFTGY